LQGERGVIGPRWCASANRVSPGRFGLVPLFGTLVLFPHAVDEHLAPAGHYAESFVLFDPANFVRVNLLFTYLFLDTRKNPVI
jgi:hypothetical protein